MKHILPFLFSFLLFATTASAQDEEINTVGFKFLDYGNQLPAVVTSAPSAVLVSVAKNERNEPIYEDWRKLAEKAHKGLVEAGMQPAFYLDIEDANAGEPISDLAAEKMRKEGVKSIIFLSHVEAVISGKKVDRYAIVATEYNGKNDFVNNGQPAYKDINNKLNGIEKKLGKKSDASGSGNKDPKLAMLSFPSGKVKQSMPDDIRIKGYKLKEFEKTEIPSDMPGGMINKRVKKDAEEYNATVDAKNRKLKGMVAVDNESPYQLSYLKGTAFDLRQMLGYGDDADTEDYTISKVSGGKAIIRTIPAQARVYKFYIEDTRDGTIYLGKYWDGDEGWEDALDNFKYFLNR